MEHDLMGQKKKRRINPILIFVGVFYLVLGLLLAGMGAAAAYALIAQGGSALQTQAVLAIAVMLVMGVIMVVAAVRGFGGRGSYLLGIVLLLLGGLFVYVEILQSGFKWVSLSTVTMGTSLLYLVGVAFGRRK